MNNTPKISVIVPVYKAEKYLNRCIDSILAQTFTDWELLLIDDGSPDRSGEICDEYASKDNRIRVFHKENGGVSSARNLGIDNAKGEWITFIDSDDYILQSFVEGLFKPINDGENVDFVQGGCLNVSNGRIISVNQSYEPFVGDNPGTVFKLFRGLTFSKLFRLENVNQGFDGLPLRFDIQMKIAEDMAFTIDYLLTIKRYAFVEERGYCYRIDNIESATKKRHVDYECHLHEFYHLYNSSCTYVKVLGLKSSDYIQRKHNLGKVLFNTILDLYRSHLNSVERIAHLKKDFTEIQLNLLKYAQLGTIKNTLANILRLKFYRIFDICTYYALKVH